MEAPRHNDPSCPCPLPLQRLTVRFLARLGCVLLLAVCTLLAAPAAWASLSNDRYDGNIYALYAGNGSLVPPRSTLATSRAEGRVAVLVFYLDDSAVSKQFAPVVSELQRLWGNQVDLIPLVTDPLQSRRSSEVTDPAHYWKGLIPQVVVIDGAGKVRLDASGQVDVNRINTAISEATGIALPPEATSRGTGSVNELNSEILAG